MRKILAAVGAAVVLIAPAAVPASAASFDAIRTNDAVIETFVLRAGAPAGQFNARFKIEARDRTPIGREVDAQGSLRYDILDHKGRKTGKHGSAEILCVSVVKGSGSGIGTANVIGWVKNSKVPTSIRVISTDLDNDGVWESASAILRIEETFSREDLAGLCFGATAEPLLKGTIKAFDGADRSPAS
jgi:hypothetical protein